VSDDPALNSEPSPDDSSVQSLHLGRKRLQLLDEHKTGNPHPTPTEMAELERASDTRESESKYSRYQPCQMIHQTISLYLLRLAPKNKAPPSLICTTRCGSSMNKRGKYRALSTKNGHTRRSKDSQQTQFHHTRSAATDGVASARRPSSTSSSAERSARIFV